VVACEWQQKMAAVRQSLEKMGDSMSVVVQQIYEITDLCSDGQLRNLSSQGSLNFQKSAGPTASSVTLPQPTGRRSVA